MTPLEERLDSVSYLICKQSAGPFVQQAVLTSSKIFLECGYFGFLKLEISYNPNTLHHENLSVSGSQKNQGFRVKSKPFFFAPHAPNRAILFFDMALLQNHVDNIVRDVYFCSAQRYQHGSMTEPC